MRNFISLIIALPLLAVSSIGVADITAVPIALGVINHNWTNDLTVDFKVKSLDSNVTPVWSGASSYTAGNGETEGSTRALYLRADGRITGFFDVTYSASVANNPNADLSKTYKVKVKNNLIEPMQELYQYGSNVCEFTTLTYTADCPSFEAPYYQACSKITVECAH